MSESFYSLPETFSTITASSYLLPSFLNIKNNIGYNRDYILDKNWCISPKKKGAHNPAYLQLGLERNLQQK